MIVFLPLFNDIITVLLVMANKCINTSKIWCFIFFINRLRTSLLEESMWLYRNSSRFLIFFHNIFIFKEQLINLKIMIHEIGSFLNISRWFINLKMLNEFAYCITAFIFNCIFIDENLKILFSLSLCLFYLQNSSFLNQNS